MNIQLSNEKQENKKLTNLLSEEKNTNKTLSQNTIKLKKEIEELKLEIQKRPNKISSNSNDKEELFHLYKKIDNLNETLKRYPVILEKDEKLISIIFESSDQTMHYSMINIILYFLFSLLIDILFIPINLYDIILLFYPIN